MSLIFTSIMFVFSVNDRSVKSLFSKSFVQCKNNRFGQNLLKNMFVQQKNESFKWFLSLFFYFSERSKSFVHRSCSSRGHHHSQINLFILKISFVQTNDTHLYCMVRIASCSGTIFSSHLKKINIFEML